MCTTCGCGHHPHTGQEPLAHASPEAVRRVAVMEDMLARNDACAARLRTYFETNGILTLNFVSSPGAGKTTVLARLIEEMGGTKAPVTVIEGDQQTENDARRIRAAGARAIQINTGHGCHLEAERVATAVLELNPPEHSCLFIENVGNLVCPAEFDLGEAHKVVVLSVTEGDDKPLKYPDMFAVADLMVLNKVDLIPWVNFDMDVCEANARRVNPRIEMLRVSAETGEGMAALKAWVLCELARVKAKKCDKNVSLSHQVRKSGDEGG